MSYMDRSDDGRNDSNPDDKPSESIPQRRPSSINGSKPAGAPKWSEIDKSWHSYSPSGNAEPKQEETPWRWNKYASSSSSSASSSSPSGASQAGGDSSSTSEAPNKPGSGWGGAWKWNKYASTSTPPATTTQSALEKAGLVPTEPDSKHQAPKMAADPSSYKDKLASSFVDSYQKGLAGVKSTSAKSAASSSAAPSSATGASKSSAPSSYKGYFASSPSYTKPSYTPSSAASMSKPSSASSDAEEREFSSAADKAISDFASIFKMDQPGTAGSSSSASSASGSGSYSSTSGRESAGSYAGSSSYGSTSKPSSPSTHDEAPSSVGSSRDQYTRGKYAAYGSRYSASRNRASEDDYTGRPADSAHYDSSTMYGARLSYTPYDETRKNAQGAERPQARGEVERADDAREARSEYEKPRFPHRQEAAIPSESAQEHKVTQQPLGASTHQPSTTPTHQPSAPAAQAQASAPSPANTAPELRTPAHKAKSKQREADGFAAGGVAPSPSEVATYDTSYYGTKSFKRPRKRYKRRNIIIAVCSCVVAIVLVYGIALFMQVKEARTEANVLMSQGKNLVSQLGAGDKESAERTAIDLANTAEKLDTNVNGFLWTPATLVPVYGSDVAQVRTLASVADTLCTEVLMPVVDAMPDGGMSEFIVDGGINVDALDNLLGTLGDEYDTIHACAAELNGLGDVHLDQLKEPIQKVQDLAGQLDKISEFAGEVSDVLPAMLGEGEPRYYLIEAMTNSEVRPGGGMVGSAGIMTVVNGKMHIGDFVSADAVPRPADGVMPVQLTDEEIRLFNTRAGLDIRDTAFIPDFPRAAEIEKGLWEYSGNQPVSGVIAIDPVFLQRMLSLTGGVTTGDGTVVDGNNAAQMLMYDVYLKYRDQNAVQDAFFAEVAGAAFNKVFQNLGDVDLQKLVKVVSESFKDRRLNVWMSNPEEEAVILELGAGGDVSISETAPATGIFFGGASGGKAFWFLDADTTVSEGHKNADGSTSYDISVTFRNTFTNEAAESLPGYFWGNMEDIQKSKAEVHLYVYLFAPGGGSISNLSTEGYYFTGEYTGDGWTLPLGEAPMTQASYNGTDVWYGVVKIDPSGTSKITYTVTTSPKAEKALEVDITPIANENL